MEEEVERDIFDYCPACDGELKEEKTAVLGVHSISKGKEAIPRL